MNNYKGYVVFNRHLAGYLLINNFKLKNVRQDIKNDLRQVYIFENTEQLKQAIEDYKLINQN